MKEENFLKKIIKKIEDEKIIPKPRWSFLLKNHLIWFFGLLSIVFGAISFSLVIYIFRSGGIGLNNPFGASPRELFLAVVPLFWLIFLLIFIYLAYLNIKHTKKAYKYSSFFILFLSIIISAVLGTSFYLFGLGKKFDNFLGENVHPLVYGRFMNPQINFWSDPERGRLSGVISEVSSDKNFFIIDLNSERWLVTYSGVIKDDIEPLPGLVVKCFGEKISSNNFKAIEVMLMAPGSGFFNRAGFKKKYIERALGGEGLEGKQPRRREQELKPTENRPSGIGGWIILQK